ncbi:MAG: hypothetical protein ACRCVX_12630 [Shewanella sp.]
MNAVATTDQPRQKLPVTTGGKIAAMIPTDIDQAYRLAVALAVSQMTPKAFGNDPNKILVGIIAGMEVGLAPFQALQSIAVINGNPSLWGDGALALIQGSGLLVDIEETDDGETATCRLVRKDRETPIVRSFSNAMAKQAGLLGKAGPWTQYQSRMRQMRARSWAMRDGFPDVLKGIGIAEEVRDYPPEAFAETQNAPRITRAALADHAVYAEAEVTEIDQSEQPPTHSQSSQQDGEQQSAAGSQEGAEAGAAPDHDDTPVWQGMVDDWKARIERAQIIGDVIAVRKEFEHASAGLPDDVAGEIQGLLTGASHKFTNPKAEA